LPRGLGDSPLKREKKARRAGVQGTTADVASSNGPGSPSYLSTGTPSQDRVHASSSSSRSYNDVFFQRRPENSSVATNDIHEELRADDSSTTAPIAAALATPTLALPEAAASSVLEAIPADVVSSPLAFAPSVAQEPVPETSVAPEYVPKANAAPEHAEAPPAKGTAQQQPSTETTPSQEAKSGFFGRIFGRLRK